MTRTWTTVKPSFVVGVTALIISLALIAWTMLFPQRAFGEELNQAVAPTHWKWNLRPIETARKAQGGTQHADVLVISVRNNDVEVTNNSNVSGTMQIMSTDWSDRKEIFPIPIRPFSQIAAFNDNGINAIAFVYGGRTLFEASVNPRTLCLNMEFKATIKHGPYEEYNSPSKKGRSAKLSWTNTSFIPLVEHYSYNFLYYNVYGQPLIDGYKGGDSSGIPIERGEDDSRTARSVSVMLNIDDSIDERTLCAKATLHDLWNEVPSASLNPIPTPVVTVTSSPAKGH